MGDHVTNMLESYVIGALASVDAARVEAHVSVCSVCAARLAHEARIDVAFEAVVASSNKTPARASRVRVAFGSMALGAGLAIAAAMLLWLVPRNDSDARAPLQETTPYAEVNADASTFTASLDLQADGASRLGVRD
jgi:anti-sigma factor RsiW